WRPPRARRAAPSPRRARGVRSSNSSDCKRERNRKQGGSAMKDPLTASNARHSPFYGPEHEAFRLTLRRFVAREIEPYATQWDEAGEFPRDLYVKAGEIGYLGLGYPAQYGGVECDRFMQVMAMQELARCGAGGI